MIAPTAQRVEEHTSPQINARIDEQTRLSVRQHVGQIDRIDARLVELDREWDIERVLELNAGMVALGGSLLSLRWPKFRAVPIVVTAFLIQHAVQGWCPPLPIFRRMGYRSEREINKERIALKALRGDFAGTGLQGESFPEVRAAGALAAAE